MYLLLEYVFLVFVYCCSSRLVVGHQCSKLSKQLPCLSLLGHVILISKNDVEINEVPFRSPIRAALTGQLKAQQVPERCRWANLGKRGCKSLSSGGYLDILLIYVSFQA